VFVFLNNDHYHYRFFLVDEKKKPLEITNLSNKNKKKTFKKNRQKQKKNKET